MTNPVWRPLGQTTEQSGVPHEGVPAWLESALWAWIDACVVDRSGYYDEFRTELVDEFERRARVAQPAGEMFSKLHDVSALRRGWDGATTIMFVDFLLWKRPVGIDAAALDRVLAESGSAWKVGKRGTFRGLERRVPEGVQEAANRAMATRGHAGERLSEAWHKVYGVSPDPSSAYSLAVKAVEDAAIPVVVPKQSGATLGHVIRQLAADGNWRLPLNREDPAAPTAETVVRMCKALWKGHHDRHGGDPTAPKSVNQDEAEVAVHMAVFLVQGFTSGLIARR